MLREYTRITTRQSSISARLSQLKKKNKTTAKGIAAFVSIALESPKLLVSMSPGTNIESPKPVWSLSGEKYSSLKPFYRSSYGLYHPAKVLLLRCPFFYEALRTEIKPHPPKACLPSQHDGLYGKLVALCLLLCYYLTCDGDLHTSISQSCLVC